QFLIKYSNIYKEIISEVDKVNEFENMFDTDTSNITSDLMDTKETARINAIIAKLNMHANDQEEITQIYTEILEDDNVSYMLKLISRNKIFVQHFPEFYEVNKYGENMINCQQNSPYHTYGVFKHTLSTLEAVGNPQIPIGESQKKVLKWTMLLHDIGKPYVKMINPDGTDSFDGHDEKSYELAKIILDRFCFTTQERKIILTLIKYHDKYLNEGEITYDNMKFLASELENNKELFYMLLDVKDSDAKAKSLDVYNKYKLVKNKYLEFINTYFSYNSNNSEKDISISENDMLTNDPKIQSIETEEMSTLELDNLIEQIINRKKMSVLFQPIIDVKKKIVHGYETFTKIESDKKIDVIEFLNRAKDVDKYDKLQQIMLINGIETFEAVQDKESKTLFVNSDLLSYDKYINKPRVYDMMAKNNIVIEFHNYEKKDFNSMQSTIEVIHKNKGFVALDNFGVGALTIDDITLLNVDYIIPDMSLINDLVNDSQKQKYMIELVTYAISKGAEILVIGIEDKETFELVESMGVRYVQGYYIARPDVLIPNMSEKVKAMFDSFSQQKI
ncbi:MAG: EAL domain-containing protein, partial [Clostridia bacterium]